jgi:hypothetical protein
MPSRQPAGRRRYLRFTTAGGDAGATLVHDRRRGRRRYFPACSIVEKAQFEFAQMVGIANNVDL